MATEILSIKKKHVPELRFQEFEADWEKKRLGDLGEFKGGGTPSTENLEYWNGDIPWISSSDIIEDDILNINITRYLTMTALSESATKIIPKESVLFVSRVGVGKLAVSQEDLCTSQDFANLITKHNSYYVAYYFLSKNKLLHQYSQGTSIKGFTIGDLKSIPINIPINKEQQKIASFLTAVDTKLQQLTTKKELLEQYKKGVMQQLFSQQLRFKEDDGSDFGDWEEKKLGEVGDIIGGGTPDTTNTEYWDGDIQWFTPTEVSKKFIDKSNRTITTLGLKKSSARILPKGTILFTSRATIAELSFAKEECTTNQGFQSIIVNELNNSEFIYYWIINNKKQFIRKSQGSTFLEISKNEMKKIKMLIPNLLEQQKIARYLSSLDAKIEAVQTQLEKTQQFKKGLLQGMFV